MNMCGNRCAFCYRTWVFYPNISPFFSKWANAGQPKPRRLDAMSSGSSSCRCDALMAPSPVSHTNRVKERYCVTYVSYKLPTNVNICIIYAYNCIYLYYAISITMYNYIYTVCIRIGGTKRNYQFLCVAQWLELEKPQS